MANYIVGDIQACYSGLKALLDKANFNPKKDKLWAVGDLIGRGTEATRTLQYLYALGDSVEAVLGNHDLHFLAVYAGLHKAKPQDNFKSLLKSKHIEKYVDWLRQRPLATLLDDKTLICHAGLYPRWSFKRALLASDEVSKRLQGKHWQQMLAAMYGNQPDIWTRKLKGDEKMRFSVNTLTRMRYLKKDMALEFTTKVAPAQAPKSLSPWFDVRNPKLLKNQKVIFGHWAALKGLNHGNRFIGLDTGYIWGQSLTLLHWEKQRLISVSAK